MDKQCICVRMIGRPIDNPSSRIAGLPTAQRLEPCVGGHKHANKCSKG